jgi:parallel beta-helix repeat protein
MRNNHLFIAAAIILLWGCAVSQAGSYALDFDGIDDWASIPNIPAYNFGDGNFTIEMWEKTAADYGGYGLLFGDNYASCLYIYIGEGYIYAGSLYNYLYSPTTYNDGQWHHIALVRTSGTGELYVDGNMVNSGDFSGYLSASQPTTWALGNTGPYPYFDYWNGTLDELRIWNYARTQTQIVTNMTRPLAGTEPGLVGYWRFDEGTGQVIGDSSTHGNNGQLGSTANPESSDPAWVISTAPFGKGLRIVSHTPSAVTTQPPDHVDITFSKDVNATSFTTDDIVMTGPDGPIVVNAPEDRGDGVWRISFERQFRQGDYHIFIGPHIEDSDGNEMDQDGDGIGGEEPNDIYDADFTISYASVIYVDGLYGNDSWDGKSGVFEGNGVGPKATIQAAIIAAMNDSNILVAGGRYTENINFYGKRIALYAASVEDRYSELAKLVDSWLVTWGAPAFDSKFDYVPDGIIDFKDFAVFAASWGFYTQTGEVTIDGDGNDVVTFSFGEDADSIIEGFTITNGGRGVYCSGSSPTIRNCTIEHNSGVGIYCEFSSSPTVSGCTMRDNNYGLHCVSSSPKVNGCTMSYNRSYGVYCSSSSPALTNCIVANNSSYGINCSSSSPSITNCTIVNNITRGISGPTGKITNCILWYNDDDLYNCSATYSCIEDGDSNVGNNAYFPYFVDMASDDYHLLSFSPCIDAGDPNSDYTKEPNGGGGRIDMGAYGNTAEATLASPDRDHDGLPDDWELLYWPEDTNLSQGPMDDFDHDGLPNIVEYQLGWDPTLIDGLVLNTTTGLYYPRIQLAIGFAKQGDTLIVYPGMYAENINFYGKALRICSYDPNDSKIVADTIIYGYNQTGATFNSGEIGNSTLDGFTITNCSNGIYCHNSSPTISNCKIRRNSNCGLYCESYSYPTVTNCTITNNTSYGLYCYSSSSPNITGGTIANNSNHGLYCYSSPSPSIKNCTITGNSGYGLYCYSSSSPVITGCTITNNTNYGLYCYSSPSPSIQNCTIMGNTGYGLYCYSSSSPAITNCVIADNHDYGVRCYSSSSPIITNCTIANNLNRGISAESSVPTILNCILWNNGDDLYSCSAIFSCIENGDTGLGNFSVDPKFVNQAAGDYHLATDSLCIDAGAPSSDYSLEPLPNGNRVNIGAYGNTSEATRTTDVDGDGLSDNWELYWFGNLSQGPNDNPDGDHFSNWIEYLFGYDPTSYTIEPISISNVSISPSQIDPTKGDVLQIDYVINEDVNVSTVISIVNTDSNIPVRQIVQTGGGLHHAVWDGTDNEGALVERYFYDVVIDANDSDGNSYHWRSADLGDAYGSAIGYDVISDDFDPYKNIPAIIKCNVSDWCTQNINVVKPDYWYTQDIIYHLVKDKVLKPGWNTFYWYGRWDVEPNAGQICQEPFDVYFDVLGSINKGVVLVDYDELLSNLRCNPYRILPLLDEVTTISYDLGYNATVTIDTYDPNGNYFGTLTRQQQAGPQQVIWYGTTKDINDLGGRYISSEGVYRIEVKTDKSSEKLEGSITVYKYR